MNIASYVCMALKETIMLLDMALRNSMSSFRWLVVFMYCLSLSVLQSGDCTQEELSSNITVEHRIGNLQVERPEDGVPSLDTGLYIMSRVAPFDGYVDALNVCAYLTFPDPNPQGADVISLHFYVAGYRLMGNNFQRISRTLSMKYDINTDEIFGCSMISFAPDQRTEVQKGDSLGVFVPDEDCHQFLISPPGYYCSAHVNIIDPVKNCSQSLYFDNIKLEDHSMPAVLHAINGHPVDMFMNLDVFIEPKSPQEVEEPLSDGCAVRFSPEVRLNHAIIAAISTVIGLGVLLLLTIMALVCAILYHNKRKVKQLKECITAGITTYSDHLDHNNQFGALYHQIHTNPVESNHSYVINSLGGHSNHSVTDHTVSSSHLVESYHSYVINSLDQSNNNRADKEQYWPPASKEEDIKHQLMKSKVDEVLRNNIKLKEYLGSGRFGVVYRGLLTVTGVDFEGGVKEVAVKTMENGASEEERIKFLQEAAIMGQFRNPYIVRIYGVLTTIQPYMLICELMSKGDLHRHLHTIKIMGTLNQNEAGAMLLSYSRQVSSAMMYLSAKGYVHCDLAARNILLSEDGVCKISDFGLSRNLQDEDYYVAKNGIIPLRWTAPEAIQDGKFSTASDVWSYGIVLYEIWSLACKPYGNLTNEQVISKILEGHRLVSPPGCPRAIYHKMISCWHPDASHRPTFNDLQISLQQPDYELLKWSEEDKAMYSENARTIGATFQEGESLFKDIQILMMYEI